MTVNHLKYKKIKRAEYIRTFKKAHKDDEMKKLAEEGLEDYLKIIDEQRSREAYTLTV